MTLNSRKTPRLLPPRASTPKHTNIGSPKRMSTGRTNAQRLSVGIEQEGSPSRSRTQPPANRRLNFDADGVRKSIESPSPFKPRHVLRRSFAQQNPFASPTKAVPAVAEVEEAADEAANEGVDDPKDDDVQPLDDGPVMLNDDDYYDAKPYLPSAELEDTQAGAAPGSPPQPKRRSLRKSGDSVNNSGIQHTPIAQSSSSKKRTRSALEEDHAEAEQNTSHSQLSVSGPSYKKQRGKQRESNEVTIHHRNGEDETIDPALLAHGDEYEANSAVEAALEPIEEPFEEPTNKGKGKGKAKAKGKGKKAKGSSSQDSNRSAQPSNSVKLNDSPSKLRNSRENSRASSAGPMNNYHLRATTPFEDAGERVSRFGRNLIQPLKYWANESRIYKHGEIEGIVRAEAVDVPKRKAPKRRRKKTGNLEDIAEESESESVMADEWEDEVGVIAGMVANWDAETQQGVPEDLVREGTFVPASNGQCSANGRVQIWASPPPP